MKPKAQITGGQRIRQRLQSMARRGTGANLSVGVPADAGTYEDGTPVATVAAYNEFGTSKTPERSLLRVPLRANQEVWLSVMRSGMPKVLDGDMSLAQMLSVTGDTAARISQQSILERIPPPNAPSTLAQKDRNTPLIDTERLINSITYRVEETQE